MLSSWSCFHVTSNSYSGYTSKLLKKLSPWVEEKYGENGNMNFKLVVSIFRRETLKENIGIKACQREKYH